MLHLLILKHWPLDQFIFKPTLASKKRPATARGPAVRDLGVGPLSDMFSSESSPAALQSRPCCPHRLSHRLVAQLPACELCAIPPASQQMVKGKTQLTSAPTSRHARRKSRVVQSVTTQNWSSDQQHGITGSWCPTGSWAPALIPSRIFGVGPSLRAKKP